MRPIYITCGLLSLILGAIGVVLPLLPTTPFIILAAFCFSKSSPRMHQWLLSRPIFGPIIIEWERYGVIQLRYKILSSSLMILMLAYPVIFKPMPPILRILIILIGAGVVAFIWRRPSSPPTTSSP